jgi:hypothetical protein
MFIDNYLTNNWSVPILASYDLYGGVKVCGEKTIEYLSSRSVVQLNDC